MSTPPTTALRRNVLHAGIALAVIHGIGTVGYTVLAHPSPSPFDAFYMTFITVATIGYGETFDLSGNMPARLFTVIIAITGIGSLWVIFSNLTALLLARTLDPVRHRARLLKDIAAMHDHYIVCGLGRIGAGVVRELMATGHSFVAIEPAQDTIDRWLQQHATHGGRVLAADASDDAALLAAGVCKARGVFAVTGEDGRNVLITLSAKHLNPMLRVVARVHDVRNVEKCRRAGADEIVSPDFTGALRIASAMLRPQASGFVDELLHRSDTMRVIDIPVPADFAARPLGDLELRSAEYLVVGLRLGNPEAQAQPSGSAAQPARWILNPGPETELSAGAVLIAMATPHGMRELQQMLARRAMR